MELAPNEMRMIGKFYHLYVGSVRSRARDSESCCGESSLVLAVEFITMAVALADLQLPINLVGQSPRFNFAGPGTQTHRPAQFLDTTQFAQLINHPMRCRRIEFAGVSFRQPANIAGKFHAGGLHS